MLCLYDTTKDYGTFLLFAFIAHVSSASSFETIALEDRVSIARNIFYWQRIWLIDSDTFIAKQVARHLFGYSDFWEFFEHLTFPNCFPN